MSGARSGREAGRDRKMRIVTFPFCSYNGPSFQRRGPPPMQWSFELDDRLVLWQIRARLLAWLGPQRDTLRLDPVSHLVAAIISKRTRDEVSSAAFARLQRRYSSWEMLCSASPGEVEALIVPVNLAERKARELPLALRKIAARSGSLDLDFLADWDEEMAMQWLRGLPGVGSKVAATVLNFSTLRKRVL